MGTYLAGRLAQLVPVVFITSFLVFALLRLVPGDPAALLAGPDASQEQVAAVQQQLGLDQPLPVQYVRWAGNVLDGDFGRSFIKRRPVVELIATALPPTPGLTAASLPLAVLMGAPLGGTAGVRRGSTWDRARSAQNHRA